MAEEAVQAPAFVTALAEGAEAQAQPQPTLAPATTRVRWIARQK